MTYFIVQGALTLIKLTFRDYLKPHKTAFNFVCDHKIYHTLITLNLRSAITLINGIIGYNSLTGCY